MLNVGFLQMNRLEDLGVDVAAWVHIPNNDKSSLIHHMGSLKGREFIKCKPDIDADLCDFLKTKKGRFKVFLLYMQMKLDVRGQSFFFNYT